MQCRPSFLINSQPAKTDGVDVEHDLVLHAAGDHEWGTILHDSAHARDEGGAPDMSKLVHAGHPHDVRKVFYGDVPRQSHVVRDGDVIVQNTIVAEVNKGHEEVSGTHLGRIPFAGRAVNRHVLAKHIVVPDLEERWLARILLVLRIAAENGALKNLVSSTHLRAALDGDVAIQDTTRPQSGSGFHVAKWADLNAFSDIRSGLDDGGWVDKRQLRLTSSVIT